MALDVKYVCGCAMSAVNVQAREPLGSLACSAKAQLPMSASRQNLRAAAEKRVARLEMLNAVWPMGAMCSSLLVCYGLAQR